MEGLFQDLLIKMEQTYLTGHFIIAMPSLMDPYFDQTVTFICEHDENGAFGIVINRETDITLQEVLSEIDISSSDETANQKKLFIGGPVQQDRGFILHKPEKEWKSTLAVNDDISLTTSRDILEAIANGAGPKDNIIALGYAGWGPGQLEREFLENSWLSCPAEDQIIFNTPIEKRWQAAADIIGIDLNTISSDTGHA